VPHPPHIENHAEHIAEHLGRAAQAALVDRRPLGDELEGELDEPASAPELEEEG